MELEFFNIFSKNTQKSNFMKIRPVRAELFYAYRQQAGRQTDIAKLIVVFQYFEVEAKNAIGPDVLNRHKRFVMDGRTANLEDILEKMLLSHLRPMCVYLSQHTCMYVCIRSIHVCTYTQHTWTYVYAAYMYVYISSIHARMYTQYACMYIYAAYMHLRIRSIHVCIYMQHTCTHVYAAYMYVCIYTEHCVCCCFSKLQCVRRLNVAVK